MRRSWQSALAAATLAWQSTRSGVFALAALSVVGAVAPVAVAWLTKLVLDTLIGAESGWTQLAGYTAGLGAVGLLVAVCPHLARYTRSEMARLIGIRSRDELFTAMDRFVGLAPFEDPAFIDRLRLAQRAGMASPGAVLDGILGQVGSALALTGFLGSLVVLSPVMTGIVVLAAAPALLAQLAVARQRAVTLWKIGPVERREFFYIALLSEVEAVKEIRLFGTGAVLRKRLLAERRTADAELRRVDKRETPRRRASKPRPSESVPPGARPMPPCLECVCLQRKLGRHRDVGRFSRSWHRLAEKVYLCTDPSPWPQPDGNGATRCRAGTVADQTILTLHSK